MTVVTLEEAKERIEELARLATSGEKVRITQGEMPPLDLTPVYLPSRNPLVFGGWSGKVEVGDDFFEPMSDEWLDLFYNGPIFPPDDEVDQSAPAPKQTP